MNNQKQLKLAAPRKLHVKLLSKCHAKRFICHFPYVKHHLIEVKSVTKERSDNRATSVILCHGVWCMCVCGGQNSWLQSRWHFHSQSISLHSNRGRRQTKERMCAGCSRSFWTKKEPLKYKLWFHIHSWGSPNVSIHSKKPLVRTEYVV